MLYCQDIPPTKPDAKIKVDLLKDQHGRVLIATTGGVMSKAQSALVKKAMPLIEEAVFKDMGLNVYVQGSSLVMEQKVLAGVSLIPNAEPFPVYDPRKDPDLYYPDIRKHVKTIIREMIQSGELNR
ncbi:hypothetical protein [Agrobacterium tumefaciens]|uniref:hypothetical protein n=1 Tax=Agrobacterium tumefaciens TaxID=358 RepID=UPI00157321EA|nr:hypothetical protein [Agrobacterium tumefaciens]NSX94495.1 hypothetical protein [Agrobacterium tumefaciens]